MTLKSLNTLEIGNPDVEGRAGLDLEKSMVFTRGPKNCLRSCDVLFQFTSSGISGEGSSESDGLVRPPLSWSVIRFHPTASQINPVASSTIDDKASIDAHNLKARNYSKLRNA